MSATEAGAAYWQPAWEWVWSRYRPGAQCAGHPSIATYCYICEKSL